ncbi:hypothetical protein, partial [Accumulibacter sp.]|uniref:hypothetical protein n=1 Tax=Accumulibacter sp. TaxID=2053492 RepID=UPI00258F1F6B
HRRVDAGLLGVELEAYGQVAPAVEKNEEKPQKGRKIDKFRPFSCRKVKFVGFPGSKSDRLRSIVKSPAVAGRRPRENLQGRD